jgi:4-amino-4-deoxy-L-arabinose transferase-like glycosyltransferase
MFATKKEKWLLALSLLLLAMVYLLGAFLDVTRDGAKYAYIAKEMLETGQWFSLHIQGEPYLQKPQFLFWLAALSFKLFGVSNGAFKLPVLIWSVVGFYAVSKIGALLFDRKTGRLAALLLAFSVVSVLFSADVHTDVLLQANVALTLWMLLAFLEKKNWVYAIGSGISLGLCLLTKGPFGVMVPFFALMGYLLASKRVGELFSFRWLLIVMIALVVASPSFLVQFAENGWDGLKFYIWQNNVGRMTGSYMGTTVDPIFYIHNLIYLFLPWTIFLFTGAYEQFKRLFKRNLSAKEHFLFWGIWVVFLLLSISKSKLPNYIHVLMPLLSIVAARKWVEIEHWSLGWGRWQKVLLMICWFLMPVVAIVIFDQSSIWLWLAMGLLAVLSYLSVKETSSGLLLSSFFTLIALGLLLNALIFPQLLGLQAQPKAAAILNAQMKAGEKVYDYQVENLERKASALEKQHKQRKTSFDKTPDEKHFFLNYELMFYVNANIVQIEDDSMRNMAIAQPGAWLFTDEKGKNELMALHPKYDQLIVFDHFNLRRSARYLNPSTRATAIEKMYLIHIQADDK